MMPSSCIDCRFQDLDIEAESAHLRLTDFPYTKDFLPQLPELAAFAERILRPSGLLVTYAGQYFLDHAVVAFRERLTWRWQISLACGGSWQDRSFHSSHQLLATCLSVFQRRLEQT